ncbi:Rpp14/Pop5 family protein [Sulfuracidifex tepidarius]|uniref:Ribonuclease P protein component 2 n=1 Tax=Sulfuracidifex tepidarius TaxID=1294262 RepID=A0A510E557_9CREN|nr:Rpp14/Pop5 family protein [Sulfuracidifex tepidarius]BBG24420.1 Ribonuclease P protein component 2 [Sulfuracidifex tepidarius]BBG27178.1 Ribonuclease P protein component 2 [Sulfuracidifex tepidarius]
MIQTILDIAFTIWLLSITVLILKFRNNRRYTFEMVNIPNGKELVKAKRYIVFNIVIEGEPISSGDIEQAVRSSLKDLLGNVWLDIANPRVIFFSINKREGIISTTRTGYKAVIASLPLIKRIGESKVLLIPTKTTGSLKKAKYIIGIK